MYVLPISPFSLNLSALFPIESRALVDPSGGSGRKTVDALAASLVIGLKFLSGILLGTVHF